MAGVMAGQAQKTIVITGANRGIGLETARALARQGATIVMACRDLSRSEPVAAGLRRETGNDRIEVMHLDLASLASVRAFAADLQQAHPVLDILVNNAGVFSFSRQETEDGFELIMGVNYLGPFLLTQLLLDALRRSPEGRIVNVSSNAHYYGKLDLRNGDLHAARGMLGFRAYAASKLAIALFTFELAGRLRDAHVTANVLHPGHVATNIWPSVSWYQRLPKKIIYSLALSPEEGAQTSIYLATSPEVRGITGTYFYRNQPKAPSPLCHDPRLRKDLWRVSAKLTRA